MLVEDESDRVMPSRRAVMDAGRYDLHHAIRYHGGYEQVDHAVPTFRAGKECKDPTNQAVSLCHVRSGPGNASICL